MAKLGVALCLLVLVWGGEVSGKPHIPNVIQSWGENIRNLVKTAQEKLAHDLAEFEASLEDAKSNVIQAGLDKWNQMVQEIKKSVEIGKKCVESSIDLGATAQDYTANTLGCLENAVSDIKSDFDTIKSSLETFINTISSIQGRVDSCRSDWKDAMNCLVQLFRSVKDEVTGEWAASTKAIAGLTDKVSNIQTTIKTCAALAAQETFPAAAEKSIAQIKECVANAKFQ